MNHGKKRLLSIAIIGCLLMLGCKPGIKIKVENFSYNEGGLEKLNVGFIFSKAAKITGFIVCEKMNDGWECDNPVWEIKAPDIVEVKNITYGKIPNGFNEIANAKELEVNKMYSAGTLGVTFGYVEFKIKPDGKIQIL